MPVWNESVTYAYLLEKIRKARVQDVPFAHVQINDFFHEDDFKAITASPEIKLAPQSSDSDLFNALFKSGYKIIEFPGCITDKDVYLNWHQHKRSDHRYNNTSCEGFGVTLRLLQPKSAAIQKLTEFLNSEEFRTAIAEKFGIPMDEVFYDAGIQKYLDGYEISPHPDIRKKALTYMVNINSDPESEKNEHHTHYLQFKDSHKYVQSYWEGNPDSDRCWVPWSWCDTKKIQNENNSIVIFSPANNTLHGVKARYDHLKYQRTQLYGNFWYNEARTTKHPAWESFVIEQTGKRKAATIKGRISTILPKGAKTFVKDVLLKSRRDVASGRLKRD